MLGAPPEARKTALSFEAEEPVRIPAKMEAPNASAAEARQLYVIGVRALSLSDCVIIWRCLLIARHYRGAL